MSQNKTIIPGQRINIEPNSSAQTCKDLPNMYRRSASAPTNMKTIVGENTTPPTIPAGNRETEAQQAKPHSIVLQDRPIVGLLYSVSHQQIGELFPVYLGRNVVGRNADCDIVLAETSVTGHHAIIVARKIQTDVSSRLIVSLTDSSSLTGTQLNGQYIDFDTHVLENMDHIIVGQAYELVFIKLDATEFHLHSAVHFMSSDVNTNTHEIERTKIQANDPTPSSTPLQNEAADFYSPSKGRSGQTRTVISTR